jgi:hypothetical protein
VNEFGLDDSSILIEFVDNQISDEDKPPFTYKWKAIIENELHFILNYPDQLSVSKGSKTDQLIITVQKP